MYTQARIRSLENGYSDTDDEIETALAIISNYSRVLFLPESVRFNGKNKENKYNIIRTTRLAIPLRNLT